MPRFNRDDHDPDPNRTPHATTAEEMAAAQIKCLYRGRVYHSGDEIEVGAATWVCEESGWVRQG
jgi:hypothetical protein